MRQPLRMALVASAVGAAGLLTALTLWSIPPSTQAGGTAPADRQSASTLPLTHVHLFTSGVGYFQREGVVEGNARIDLTFPVHHINDLLKSLTLQDLDGGRISVVGYDSHDPLDKTLRGFAINLHGNPSYGQILNQARGEKVEVGLRPSGTLAGTILGVEKQKQAGKEGPAEAEVLNLWCADGMRSVKLADVQRIRFLNPTVDREIQRALEVLARTHDNQKKTVTLSFEGQGKRRVRVGYVIENPIWKTSYRLVVGKNGKPSLQGWAVVDNPTDEDWKDVRLALVSGRPLSFVMDLYTPLYVPRPRVELELFAGLRPPTHSGPMDWMALQREALAKHAPGRPPEKDEKTRPPVKAEAVGEFFQYVLEHPVSLPRQKSALFPILDRQIEGTPVSVYNEGTLAKHPLMGLRFKNTTGLYLMQGPVTVFADGTYAGDALLPNMQPGEQRLLSCAIDLGMEVEPQVSKPSERLVTVRIDKGILYASTKVREGKTYLAHNRSPHERVLLIEHPFRAGFTLVSPEKPGERTREVYRFEVKVPAGKTVTLEVVEERTLVQQVVLTDADDQTILRYLSGATLSSALRDALTTARELKGKLAATRRAIAQQERQLKAIVEDQARLRANMERVPKDSAAYQRYLTKFDQQETEIERLQEAVRQLQAVEQQQRQAYEEFLARLRVE
ncbi:MAG: DUF4139 domain-containing protein [Gemmataceae bacterium]|nr:DUF4139 domain-containing protein [Gemmataceae bacterium]